MYLVLLVKYGVWIGLLYMRNGLMGVSLLDYLVNKCNQKDLISGEISLDIWMYARTVQIALNCFFFCI